MSWSFQTIGWPFLALFVIASVVVTLATNPKNLFVVVASTPILFAFFLVITGWLVNRSELPEQGDPFSTTSLVMSVYPLVEHYPVVLITFIGCAVIAGVRIWLLKRQNQVSEKKQVSERQRVARDDRENRRIAQRARARSNQSRPNQVSVQELLSRRDEQNVQPPRPRQRRESSRSEGSSTRPRRTAGRPADRVSKDFNKEKPNREGRSRPHPRLSDDLYDE